jgi:hypothetical protein
MEQRAAVELAQVAARLHGAQDTAALSAVTSVLSMVRVDLLLLLALSLAAGCGRENEWVEVRAEDGSFRVEMPGRPDRVRRSIQSPLGDAPVEMWLRHDGDRAFVVGYTEYPPDVRSRVGVEELLDSAREGAVANARGRLLRDEPREARGAAGRRIEIEAEGGAVRVRGDLFVTGRRLYQVLATTAPERAAAPEVERFLASFELLTGR